MRPQKTAKIIEVAGVAERFNAFACKANVWGFDSLRRRPILEIWYGIIQYVIENRGATRNPEPRTGLAVRLRPDGL